MFDTGSLDGFKGVVNRWLLPRVVFFSVFRGSGASEVAKQFIKLMFFHTLSMLLVLIIIYFF